MQSSPVCEPFEAGLSSPTLACLACDCTCTISSFRNKLLSAFEYLLRHSFAKFLTSAPGLCTDMSFSLASCILSANLCTSCGSCVRLSSTAGLAWECLDDPNAKEQTNNSLKLIICVCMSQEYERMTECPEECQRLNEMLCH